MKPGVDILRINYRPKMGHRISGVNSKSPAHKIKRSMKSKSKSRSKKYIINRDVRKMRRGKEDAHPKSQHRNKELYNLEKLLQERKRRIQTAQR